MSTKKEVLKWFKMKIDLFDGQIAEANRAIICAQTRLDILRDLKGDLVSLMRDVEELKVVDAESITIQTMEAQR
jgi:hypothetical protein